MGGSLTFPSKIADVYKILTFLDEDNYLSTDDGISDVKIPEVKFKKLHIDDEFKIGGVEVSFSALGTVLAGQQFNNDSYGTFTKITINGTEKYIKLYDSLSSV